MMKKLIRTTLILTAALLASNAYAEPIAIVMKNDSVETIWKTTTTKDDKRKAQDIFDQDVAKIEEIETLDEIHNITRAIAKIIKKMSSGLGFGGMDAHNQARVRSALNCLEGLFMTKDNEDKFTQLAWHGRKAADGKMLCGRKSDIVGADLISKPNDKALTRQIKDKLGNLLQKILPDASFKKEFERKMEDIKKDIDTLKTEYKLEK